MKHSNSQPHNKALRKSPLSNNIKQNLTQGERSKLLPKQEVCVAILAKPDNEIAKKWGSKIQKWIHKNHPRVRFDDTHPDIVIILGGDGTIIDAARQYLDHNPLFVGLNLGTVGFMASVRDPKGFLPALKKLFSGSYEVAEHMVIQATVFRHTKQVWHTTALNEIMVQNILGMVELDVAIEDHPIQSIRGTGVFVATATGSTAYNLSAHGPIIMPNIKCMIVTELLDHNIPTPSIVIKHDKKITIHINAFRKHNRFLLAESHAPVDVVLSADTARLFPLEEGDTIVIERAPSSVRFIEFESSYFFKSLGEKFGFR
jgi:NAD+ kinase